MNADGATPPDPESTEQDEQLLALLRAADPARAATTDTAALRAAVDERIAKNRAGTPRQRTEGTDDVGGFAAGVPALDRETGGGGDRSSTGADDGGTEGADRQESPDAEGEAPASPVRPRRRQWMVAAGIAGLLAVGAGGYAIGAQRSVPPVVVAGQDAQEEQADQPEAETMMGDDGADTDDSADTLDGPQTLDGDEAQEDRDSAWQRTSFVDGGLPTDTGQAEAWVMDPSAAYTEERITQIASDLGIDGEPEETDDAWRVSDGATRSVRIDSDAMASLTYLDESGLVPCPADDGQDADSGVAGTDEDDSEGVPARCEPLPTSEQPEEAVRVAQEFLDALGVDTSPLSLEGELRGPQVSVTAAPEGRGHDGASVWELAVNADGVVAATGPLAEPVSMGDYPTISAAEAVTRVADPRFGANARGVYTDPGTAEPPPPLPDADSAIPWPVREVVFTEAELTLAGYYAGDGGQLRLLPTWELRSDEGESWQVLAVDESVLDLS